MASKLLAVLTTLVDQLPRKEGRAQGSLEARALAYLIDNPEETNKSIAQAIGCNRTSLYRCKRFLAARRRLKGDGLDGMPQRTHI